MEGRLAVATPRARGEAGVLSRVALEGAGGKLAGGMPFEAMEGMPAVPRHGMEGARAEAVHPMTGEAMMALRLDAVLGRPSVSVDNDRDGHRCMPGGGALRGQRKAEPCKQQHHHHHSRSGTTHGDLPAIIADDGRRRPGIIADESQPRQRPHAKL
jgi:hypothetical protein